MTSCVDVPAATSRRAARAGVASTSSAAPSPPVGSPSITSLDDHRDALLAAVLRRDPEDGAHGRLGALAPGVVDTRPHVLGLIDLRDGVQVRDGVDVDTVVDVDTLEVRRVVDDAPPGPPAPPVPPAPAAPSPYMRRSELRRLEARASRRSSGTLSVPQVGIASALGLATIAAPLSGSLSAPGQAGATQLVNTASSSLASQAAEPGAAALRFPQTVAAPENAVEAARVVVDDSQLTSVPQALAAPSRLLVTRASRGSAGRAVLPGCDGAVPDSGKNAPNGRLPASSLCTLWDKKEKLRSDAAVALAKLNVAYKQQFGKDVCVTDSYRTLNEQYTVRALRGGFAASPGTSEHGWGLAVDLCGGSSVASTPTFTWLRANAGRYGWHNPDWAQTQLYEPWHWEFDPSSV